MTTESQPIHTRTDVLTNRQVILATQRGHRPVHVTTQPAGKNTADDPFLQGNEHDTPRECLALRRNDSVTNAEGWLLRVVPNRYPAVAEHAELNSLQVSGGLADCSLLQGVHDVIVECPDHRVSLTQLSEVEVARILIAWQRRCQKIAADGRFRFVNIFRNEGFGAGASLPHCHSQLLASNLSSSVIQSRLSAEQEYQSEHSDTLFQNWLNSELTDKSRIVRQTQSHVVVCPFASRLPWQIRICPNTSGVDDFSILSVAQLCELAADLLSVVNALSGFANGVAFNLTLSIPPLDNPTAFPWMLDVLPRPNRFAGFELMTDVDILTVSPEQAADAYRKSVSWLDACDGNDVCPTGFVWG